MKGTASSMALATVEVTIRRAWAEETERSGSSCDVLGIRLTKLSVQDSPPIAELAISQLPVRECRL